MAQSPRARNSARNPLTAPRATLRYNPQTLGPRVPGDCVPSVLTFQSGYISGYLVVAAAATLHLQMTFAETEELRLYPNYSSRPKLPGKHQDEVLWHTDAGYTLFGAVSGKREHAQADTDKIERMAQSMVNVWTPLVPVTRRNGCMQFSVGSHKLGLVHHSYPHPDGNVGGREGKWLHIDPKVRQEWCSPESGRVIDVELEPGDIVLFHQHMLHSSEHPNMSDQVRWACDFRYQDADEDTLRSTQGHLARSKRRPEQCVATAEQWAAAEFG